MSSEVKIPYGYKRLAPDEAWAKGDGIWNGRNFIEITNENAAGKVVSFGNIVIRRCTVEQVPLFTDGQ